MDKACALRLTNAYGPGMRVKDARQTFLGIWIRLLLEGKPIKVFGDKENGVQSLIHYPIPIHMQKPCTQFKRDPNGLLISESHSNDCLSLPCNPHLSDKDKCEIIKLVNSFCLN
jgi:hypothetical protein